MMDGYKQLKVIGEGSFGRVFLVQGCNESQQYVMKEIHLSKNPTGLQRSRQEAILIAKMKHPNIVAFVDSLEAEGHLYIVMEYCDGGDLTQKLLQQKEKLFPEEMVLNLFVQICLGMKHIHDKRVLHRDIKTKNIFLTKNGVVKLGDFGSAHLLKSPMAFAHTYVGTPYYVSPEIWENKPYNNKSDIWALGCVLYEICALRHPFQSNSWKNLILKICNGSYPPIPRHYSYDLHYIIKQMFKRAPKDRPSINTILARRCFAKLISSFLSPELMKKEFNEVITKERRTAQTKQREVQKANVPRKCEGPSSSAGGNKGSMKMAEALANIQKWNLAEGENVKRLTQKTLEETTSQIEGGSVTVYPKVNLRKQWNQEPPESVLNFLQNINVNLASKTYTINKGVSGTSLIGPLSNYSRKADNIDGEMETIKLDPDRFEPRSDDEDTDFEEADGPDWVDEMKQLLENHL
ncbi:serine/threonine-protein kinase Nek3 isoform X2 [Narcine bancroftii]|uniref:serine/threonine-protein kinase Nek3 isoform X2 n=1 Tax=Narcine bancroftii TaxID=1343680 RepID=UPI003831B764